MPKVEHVRARKDYPEYGIAKGDMYYTWKFPRQGRRLSKTVPRRSQLTMSDFLSQIYEMEDSLEVTAAVNRHDFVEQLRTLAEEVRALGEEEQSKYENMPDGLQQGPTGELLQTRAEGSEAIADQIDGVADSINEWEPESKVKAKGRWGAWREFARGELESIDWSAVE